MLADTLPDGHSQAFRRMIAHPTIVQRLNMLLGHGYAELFEPVACNYIPGTSGGSITPGPAAATGVAPPATSTTCGWTLG